jgi:hypothetical protein
MTTARQIYLIQELLDELCWTRQDIRKQVGENYGDYEELDGALASELISALIDAKRSSR